LVIKERFLIYNVQGLLRKTKEVLKEDRTRWELGASRYKSRIPSHHTPKQDFVKTQTGSITAQTPADPVATLANPDTPNRPDPSHCTPNARRQEQMHTRILWRTQIVSAISGARDSCQQRAVPASLQKCPCRNRGWLEYACFIIKAGSLRTLETHWEQQEHKPNKNRR
jgi:hypothetical protein